MPPSVPAFVARNRELAEERDAAIEAGDGDRQREIEDQLRHHNLELVGQVAARLADHHNSQEELEAAGKIALRGIIRRMPSPLFGEVGPHVARSVRDRLERHLAFG